MRAYLHNSPEAMARIIVMCLLADSDIDPSELDHASLAKILTSCGLSQHDFMMVLKHYLEDIAADNSAAERINLLEPARINQLLAEVNQHNERIRTLATALSVCKGDHALNNAELAVFQHIMRQWQMDLTDLAIEASQP